MTEFGKLMSYCRDTIALGQACSLMHWDQETMMPKPAGEQRATCLGAVQSIIHERQKAPQIGELLVRIPASSLDETERAQLHQIRRSYDRALRVPESLSRALAEQTSRALPRWAEARQKDEPAILLPILEDIVRLKREESQCLSDGAEPYDTLLDEFEEGLTGSYLDSIFEPLRGSLVSLRQRIVGSGRPQSRLGLQFDGDRQMKLARRLAETFGYSLESGRLDLVEHPFCIGTAADVRITTRIDKTDPFNCLYSTIHEVGHAVYETNIDRRYSLTPIGQGASMGVHESQSRICENQLGRSRAFCHWLFEVMVDEFGNIGLGSAEDLYFHVNQVRDGYIRTEADEVQYNLHVMLRFDLERDLVNGQLEVRDLETAWNDRFAADFGFSVDRPSHGFLQDVHWPAGLFGYFPTYSLGNIYAGCLYKAMRQQLPTLDESLRNGDPSPAMTWLRQELQQHGSLNRPLATISAAAGEDVTVTPLIRYLDDKFDQIYN